MMICHSLIVKCNFSHLFFKVKSGPTYNCAECSCVFKSLGSLNTHISKMHMGGPQNPAGSAETAHILTVSGARGLGEGSPVTEICRLNGDP